MSSQLTPEQNDCVRKIAESENISDYELEVNFTSVKGDGYMGIISTVNIISEQKQLNLIIKTAETNEELRQKIVIRKAYLREIYIYNKVLREFDNFQKKHNWNNGFNGFAKIYGSCEDDCKEFLVLENLKEVGYKLWNRKVPMNAEHIAPVFSEYAKFHAVSLAMKNQEPEMFDQLTKHLRNIFENAYSKEEFERGLKITLDKGFKAVKGDSNATEAFQRFSDSLPTFLFVELQQPDQILVVNHGDCWCNNMMFKYEDNSNPQTPTKVCLLDWQLAKTGSPMLDLVYFFFASSSKDILYDYKTYLKIYHETFSENLRKLSCDPEEIFPYALLESHWKKYAKFGLYIALIVITVMVSDAEEAPVFKEVVKTGGTIFDTFDYESINDNSNPQTPTKVCLLDWQLAKTGSPVLDLAYFFFACSSKDILYDYKAYLQIYHETVSENLRKLSCDPEEIFPFALLESHWKKYAKFGLYMALIVITVMVSDSEEAPVLKDVVKTRDTIFDTFNYESIHVSEYNQRILDIVTFLAEQELI